MMSRNLLVGLVLTISGPAAAISTDRPTVAASAKTVGANRLQIEMGAQSIISAGTMALSAPTLIRFGIGNAFELRADSALLSASGDQITFPGFGVGAKYTLVDLTGATLGLLGGVSVPSQDEDLVGYASLLVDGTGGWWANAGWSGPAQLVYAVGYGVAYSGTMTPFAETAGSYDLDHSEWTGSLQGGVVWASGNFAYDVYLQSNLDGFDSHLFAVGASYVFGEGTP